MINIYDAGFTHLKYMYDDARICGAVLISNPLFYRRSWHDFRAVVAPEKSSLCQPGSRVRANFFCGKNRIKKSF